VGTTDDYVNVGMSGNTEGQTGFGGNDISDAPNFLDADRNLAGWDTENGGAGTVANAFTEMLKLNQSDFDSDYLPSAAVTWVRAGFAPTNSAYDGTAHDGGDIGAIAYQAATSTARNMIQPVTDNVIRNITQPVTQ